MAGIAVESTDDAHTAFAGAQGYLKQRPVEHNLHLSLLHRRMAYPEPGRYWTVHPPRDRDTDAEAVGFALQSPRTFSVAVTPMGRPRSRRWLRPSPRRPTPRCRG